MKNCISLVSELRSTDKHEQGQHFPLCLSAALNCENGKTTEAVVKFIPKKIMKIINFPSQLLQIGWCTFIARKCYKLKLFIFNASRKKHFHPDVHATLLFDIVSAFPILYGLRRKECCFYYVDVLPHTSWSKIQKQNTLNIFQ